MPRSSKIARVLHIKRHTAGTSNEISFSVLDARNSGDESEKSARKAQGVGGLVAPLTPLNQDDSSQTKKKFAFPWFKQGSSQDEVKPLAQESPQLSSSDTASFTKEVGRRKRIRRVLRIASVGAACILLVGGLGAGAYILGSSLQQKNDDSNALRSLSTKLDSFDKSYLFPLDEQVNKDLSDFNSTQAQFTLKEKKRAQKELRNLKDEAQKTKDWVKGSQEKGLSEQLEAAVVSRETMYMQGLEIVSLRLQVLAADKELGQIWQLMLDSNKETKSSAHLVSQDKPSYEESNTKLEHAQSELKDAQVKIQELEQNISWLKLSDLSRYIALRLDAIDKALASNKDALDENKKAAEDNNAQANKLEKEAAEIAASFPSKPEDLVSQAVKTPLDRAQSSYFEARKKASTADSYLRDYFKQGFK